MRLQRKPVVVALGLGLAAVVAIAAWSSFGEPTPGPEARVEAPRPDGSAGPGSRPAREADGRPPSGRSARLTLETPRGASPVVWLRAGARVHIRSEPGGRGELVETVERRTEFGSPRVFAVVRHRGGWAGVSTASLPNGELGWVRLDSRRMRAGWTRTSVVVDLSERRAELHEAGRLVHSFTVTVGAAESPTPTGRFAITDTFRGGLHPAYGCCALALSATQPHVPSGWRGGRRIAIHGTNAALGVAASKGCVRAADADVARLLDEVDLGTPVRIRA